MAASIVLRRANPSSLLSKISNPVRYASVSPSVYRSFNTNSQVTSVDDSDRCVDVERRPYSDRPVSRRRDTSPSFFPGFTDVLDPFSPTRTLSQVLNMMDQLMENPFTGPSRSVGGGSMRGWDVKEDENALHIRIDMPGLSKEDVKVAVEQNTLIIKGEGGREAEDEESGRRYSSRLDLPLNVYKTDEIKAEMKNGVLKVVVPKVKEAARKDVREVKVE
ncbi:small heat shock protein chloroplastic-like [Tripterygium wilfordii]|uniref:Small heat shock protein chloroplastic-like n=1 Tax=Tripterygium wilfordii TaxID=458696 RepID=A0A7J7C7C9_TRIWF|nr:small heat shock protein, chloroplastic isoform X2 [Tripterygium wilfordii]KAF5729855.1 small heat shock protein chloroplastic-like [Tripterygium wilfordii]